MWYDNSSPFYKLSCGWAWLFVVFFVWVCLVERTVLGSGCLVGLHACLALWMRVWMTDSFAEMGWFVVKVPICVGGFSVDWIQWSWGWVCSGYQGRGVICSCS